jgi:hypothetical protein
MAEAPPTRRRWYQFGLWTMFLVVTLCAISAALLTREGRRYAREHQAIDSIKKIKRLGVSIDFHDRLLAPVRHLAGDDRLTMFETVVRIAFPPQGLHLEFGGGGSAMLEGVSDAELEEMRPALARLPYLASLDLNESNITDEGLAHLRGLTSLRRLDVGGTKVTNDGIASLRRSLPDLVITK